MLRPESACCSVLTLTYGDCLRRVGGEPVTLRLVVVVALALALVTSCDELVPGTTPGPAPETTDPPAPLVAGGVA